MSPIIALAVQLFTSTASLSDAACTPATAARVEALATHDVADVRTLTEAVAVLAEPDGVTCLMGTWIVPKLYLRHDRPEVLTRAIVAGLASRDIATAARAARIARVVGVASLEAYAAIVTHFRMSGRALERLHDDLEQMPTGPKRAALERILAARTSTSQV